jgi:glutamate synthase domain-containing protein 2
VPQGQDVFSPTYHKAFSTPLELCAFIARLRELSGGKPVGFKLCVGDPSRVRRIVKAMLQSGIYADFIVVDGGEGGTGAAPVGVLRLARALLSTKACWSSRTRWWVPGSGT